MRPSKKVKDNSEYISIIDNTELGQIGIEMDGDGLIISVLMAEKTVDQFFVDKSAIVQLRDVLSRVISENNIV